MQFLHNIYVSDIILTQNLNYYNQITQNSSIFLSLES